jgi:hypothetical protein
MSRALLPICTAWVRRFAPSLSNSRLEWVFTVFSLTNRRSAISPIAQAVRDEAENFQFAGGDGELAGPRLVGDKRIVLPSLRRNFSNDCFRDNPFDNRFPDDRLRPLSSQRQPQPDAERGKKCGDQRAVDFDRMLDNQEAILGQFQDRDEQAAANAIEQDVAKRAAARTWSRFPGCDHGRS